MQILVLVQILVIVLVVALATTTLTLASVKGLTDKGLESYLSDLSKDRIDEDTRETKQVTARYVAWRIEQLTQRRLRIVWWALMVASASTLIVSVLVATH